MFLDYAGVITDDGVTAVRRGAVEALRRLVERGVLLFALSWRPELGSLDRVDEWARRVADIDRDLGVAIEKRVCPHVAGPPICWCRKPLPGLAVELLVRHRLDPRRCAMVVRSAADRTLADRLGMIPVESLDVDPAVL